MLQNVTPEWAKPFVNLAEADVVKCTDGKYAIMSHELQTTLFVADTAEELYREMHTQLPSICVKCGLKRMWDGGGYWCPSCDEDCGNV